MTVSSALQAMVGMGLALIAVPLLALAEPAFIPGPMLCAGLLLCIAMAYRGRHELRMRDLSWSIVGLGVGTVIGAGLLAHFSGPSLPRIFGALVLIAVTIVASGVRLPASPRGFLAAGTASGVMGTMVGIHGPPIALVLQNAQASTIRAMLGAYFAVAGVGAVIALAFVGLFGMRELILSAVLVPGVIAGFGVAQIFGRHVAGRLMRIAILTVSAAGGVALLLH